MIAKEILEIVRDAADDGTRLNEIADQFRSGRDLNEILTLLNSDDPACVSVGAWILGELRFELYDSDEYISRLVELTEHKDPSVRFHALGALFPALERGDATTRTLLKKLCSDENEGVRRSAEAAAARLSLK
jgi:HEAT repeat protein